jgi:hypothetical protein
MKRTSRRQFVKLSALATGAGVLPRAAEDVASFVAGPGKP